MDVFIRTNGIRLAQEWQTLLQERLHAALAHCGRRIHRVHVFVTDTNGDKGGLDKVCRVVAHVRRHPTLVVEDRDHDLQVLIDRIVNRVGLAAERRLLRPRLRGQADRMTEG